jgi:hypothetical protein
MNNNVLILVFEHNIGLPDINFYLSKQVKSDGFFPTESGTCGWVPDDGF